MPNPTTRPRHLGHKFDCRLFCRCGKTWQAHQLKPRPCPAAPVELIDPTTKLPVNPSPPLERPPRPPRQPVSPEDLERWTDLYASGRMNLLEIALSWDRPKSTVQKAVSRELACQRAHRARGERPI